MKDSSASIPLRDLVFVGGGHAHVHVLKMLGMQNLDNLRITLISRDLLTPYSGMIPGYVCGYYTKEECHLDLYRLCSFASVRYIHAEVHHIDTTQKLIYCQDLGATAASTRPPIRYDILSIDIGISPTLSYTSADSSHITAVKPIDKFADRWEAILTKVDAYCKQIQGSSASSREKTCFKIAVVGGGSGGVELSFAMHYRLHTLLTERGIDSKDVVKVCLLNKGASVMSNHGKAVQDTITRHLIEKGIELHNHAEVITAIVTASNEKVLVCKDGREVAYDEAIWCTQASAQAWLRNTDLDLDQDGFIQVQATLESTNRKGVFACGDICHNVKHPRPKAGVFAVRAGPPLLANIKHLLFNEPLEEWEPQTEFLGIIHTGYKHAVSTKAGVCVEGEFIYELKDKIDRNWMKMYQELPNREEMMKQMQEEAKLHPVDKVNQKSIADAMGPSVFELLAKAKMRCAGCGSKVGASVLSRAMKRVKKYNASRRPEVLAGIGDDAAIVKPPSEDGVMVQTIDYFKSFVSDPFLFGQIAANHALSDCFAMNADPITALALCTLPYGPEKVVEDELVHMLAGMCSVLHREGCMLVGGHTAEGSEPALGLSVYGFLSSRYQPFPKGLSVDCLGYSIILTKAIGTGTILAADMRGLVSGSDMKETFHSMVQSNSIAAKILGNRFKFSDGDSRKYHCMACTDVTGFGLLGHLIEMIQQADHQDDDYNEDNDDTVVAANHNKKKLAVDLYLKQVPALPGAIECVRAGILSTLHPQNIRCNQAVSNIEEASRSEIYPLLFDPQTSGGLLACVPKSELDSILRDLRSEGFQYACEIGTVVERLEEDFAPLVQLLLD